MEVENSGVTERGANHGCGENNRRPRKLGQRTADSHGRCGEVPYADGIIFA